MTDGSGFAIERVGRDAEPVVTIDGFVPDPDALRAAAAVAAFGPGLHHYPGIRAALPDDYVGLLPSRVSEAVRAAFGYSGAIDLVDASFSMVTRRREELGVRQRLPHCDAFGAERIAMVHYLSPAGGDGTAFFRHRSTGIETVDAGRAPIFFDQLDAELRHGALPRAGYIAGDTPLFERIGGVAARYNRAVLYRSYLLHSGAIGPETVLSPDPATGRLTVTAFFAAAAA